MWESMLYFFGTGVAETLDPKWDLAGWLARCRAEGPLIEVQNVDMLFRLYDGRKLAGLGPGAAARSPAAPGTARAPTGTARPGPAAVPQWLRFVGPRQVEVVRGRVGDRAVAGPGQMVVSSRRSLISSGTELKVFRGEFERGTQLDSTIKGMADSCMTYPLEYGYCLVGRVESVGPARPHALPDAGASRQAALGDLVLAFAPHGSRVVVAAESVLVVPEGVEEEDACYLPAVETALSLVHDAAPLVGERVGVIGQGLIGLLVTGILGHTVGDPQRLLAAVELLPERATAARQMGAGEVLHPAALCNVTFARKHLDPPLDVAVEVSGHPSGLQAAIDSCRPGGRVVIGSWYGNRTVQLCLGLDFHRSQITLKSSQVSKIPAELSTRWDKQRRFAEAWEWVRRLRPSRLLTTMSLPLAGAQEAYQALDAGRTLGVEFVYR